MKTTDLLNEIYSKYSEYFESGFHNCLWQIMINESHKGKVVVFYPAYNENGLELSLAHGQGGYFHTYCVFKSNVNFDLACTISEEISSKIWKFTYGKTFDSELYDAIMSESMKN